MVSNFVFLDANLSFFKGIFITTNSSVIWIRNFCLQKILLNIAFIQEFLGYIIIYYPNEVK